MIKRNRWKNKIQICIGILLVGCFLYVVQQPQTNEIHSKGFSKESSETLSTKSVTRAKPAGLVTGIYAKTDGVLVLEAVKIRCDDGKFHSPSVGKIQEGDYILSCNEIQVSSKKALIEVLGKSKGNMVKIKLYRDGKERTVQIQPVLQDKQYKLGIWVRDDVAGIGTITFVTEQQGFAALGHCISDIDLGYELRMKEGSIHRCTLTDIRKGKTNYPGALIGYIHYKPKNPRGELEKNTECGIFGYLYEMPEELEQQEYLPIAKESEIESGEATLVSDLSGKRKEYKVRIKKLSFLQKTRTKDFEIEITDPALLELTGGIVQGMSGSPIIQNGKIVGALTHVFVKEPRKGYGVFIDEMLQSS